MYPDWDSVYHCDANSCAVCNTTTVMGSLAFIDCLEVSVSEIVSVSKTRPSWEVRLTGVMVHWLQMNFHLQHS